ncbi:MAG: SBBP repeat-containing protein [Deltaproteobacteria bacterium]|nr:SBBP repeat-containing protein [Deltaproteobacteria bacterium]
MRGRYLSLIKKSALLLPFLIVCTLGPVGMPLTVSVSAAPSVMETFGKVPLYFVENRGQTDPRVAFHVQGQNTSVYFTNEGVTFRTWEYKSASNEGRSLVRPVNYEPAPSREVASWVLKLDFVGADPKVVPVGRDETQARISYFTGSRDQWKAGLRTYSTIVYPDLWPGIDLIYSGGVNRLKYSFLVKPGADPNRIRLAYRGATSVSVDGAGRLVVDAPVGGFTDEAPVAFQDVDGTRVQVAARFKPTPETGSGAVLLGFDLGPYDPRIPFLLDPVMLVYCGYIGGETSGWALGIAVDAQGNAYVTGYTSSTEDSFPVTVGPDLTFNGGFTDVFVAKVNAAGTALLYCGYIGGLDVDTGYGIAVDTQGNAYVTGITFSTQDSFPVTVGPDLTHNGYMEAFVVKVNAAGTALDYCGYIGGEFRDEGRGIAVDDQGNAYVIGYTGSNQNSFPATKGPKLEYSGSGDAFVAKVNAAGTTLDYCGYIGGDREDRGFGIAVDDQGNAYVTGSTYSAQDSFPAIIGPNLNYSASEDAFVAKVNAAGTAFDYCGYIGGEHKDAGNGIAVDGQGNAYVTGSTFSTEDTFPVIIGPDLTYNGGYWDRDYYDAFVAKVNAADAALDYCGYIGGDVADYGLGIAVDAHGNAYVTGHAQSGENTFPVTVGPDLTYNGESDVFVSKVSVDGTVLDYCGYIGGNFDDYGSGIALDPQGNAYIAGRAGSAADTFPVTVGPYLTESGYGDAFVAKIVEAEIQPILRQFEANVPSLTLAGTVAFAALLILAGLFLASRARRRRT